MLLRARMYFQRSVRHSRLINLTLLVLTVTTTMCMLMFVNSARNVILYPVWPRHLRHVSTFQILKVVLTTKPPHNVGNFTDECPPMRPMGTRYIHAIVKAIPTNTPTYFLQQLILRSPLRSVDDLNHFLPALSEQDKKALVYLYIIASAYLTKAGVVFYLNYGSLLGAYRHHGIVPWDDDIDICINVTHWQRVRQVLSCLDGYSLQVNPNMHWKFSRSGDTFPFIDIFFMAGDDHYIWPIVHYFRSDILPRRHVFPLRRGLFEGLDVSIPRRPREVIDVFTDVQCCVSSSVTHKSHKPVREVTMPCSFLTYIYKMYNIDGTEEPQWTWN